MLSLLYTDSIVGSVLRVIHKRYDVKLVTLNVRDILQFHIEITKQRWEMSISAQPRPAQFCQGCF